MGTRKDGGSAFPNNGAWGNGFPEQGMTLRDYFAGLAMQAMLNEEGDYQGDDLMKNPRLQAERAYAYADAMLEARDK